MNLIITIILYKKRWLRCLAVKSTEMQWIVIIYYIISVAVATDIGKDGDHEAPIGRLLRTVGFDLTKTGHEGTCPSPWYKITVNGKDMCRVPSDTSGCSSVTYHLFGAEYNQVRGFIRGYQKGTTDGFRANHEDDLGIDEAYVDGVSITIGYPRSHVWTYAAGLCSDGNEPKGNCPCSVTHGPNPPSFVGENYYCQSGSQWLPDHDTYSNQSLWQGTDCTNEKNNCCANVGLPWFYRNFPSIVYDDIEVRICYNQPYSDEAVLIDQLKLEIYEP